MSVEMRLPQSIGARVEATPHTISCPYNDCAEEIRPVVHAEIAAVWQGHGPAPTFH